MNVLIGRDSYPSYGFIVSGNPKKCSRTSAFASWSFYGRIAPNDFGIGINSTSQATRIAVRYRGIASAMLCVTGSL